jgi:hypothetical protein
LVILKRAQCSIIIKICFLDTFYCFEGDVDLIFSAAPEKTGAA